MLLRRKHVPISFGKIEILSSSRLLTRTESIRTSHSPQPTLNIHKCSTHIQIDAIYPEGNEEITNTQDTIYRHTHICQNAVKR